MSFRLGLAQCRHPQDGNVVAMVDRWAMHAKESGVDLLVFPESLMTPFDASADEFAVQAEPLDGPCCTALNAIAAKHGLWMVYTANERPASSPVAAPTAQTTDAQGPNASRPPSAAGDAGPLQRPFNTAVVVDSLGKPRGVYRKVHLFDTDFVRESDKVSAGAEFLAPVETPFGRIGIGICYDLRFPEQARAAAHAGADVMVYPSAWVDGPRKVDQWRTLLAARAIENEFFVAGLSRCDRAFGGAHRDYAGHSCVFGPLGEQIAQAKGIEEELLVADIDVSAIERARAAMPVLSHCRKDIY